MDKIPKESLKVIESYEIDGDIPDLSKYKGISVKEYRVSMVQDPQNKFPHVQEQMLRNKNLRIEFEEKQKKIKEVSDMVVALLREKDVSLWDFARHMDQEYKLFSDM